ncbi:hypothetical protein GmHk_19G054308 [Glycine max]|nr:hypothetical protein GmHk_19G054308 [Glycine max]
MQQGQTYIPIVRFPDSNYSIKAENQNNLPSSIVSSPSVPLCVAQSLLLFMFVSPNARFYIPKSKEI